jgi:hypothetical protein
MGNSWTEVITGAFVGVAVVVGIAAIVIALFALAGWIFSLAWNAFAAKTLGAQEIDIYGGVAAVVLIGFVGGMFHK